MGVINIPENVLFADEDLRNVKCADPSLWQFQGYEVPDYMRQHVLDYVELHRPVGGFLEAVISNKLFESFNAADDNNFANIPAYVNFFYNHAPSSCWGSKEAYQEWIQNK